MRDTGLRPNDLVGTYMKNSPQFVFNLIGAWAIGCAPALINFNLRGEALIHSLNAAKSKILIVDEDTDCQRRIEEVRWKIENELHVRIIFLDDAVKARIYNEEPTRPDNDLRDGVTGDSPVVVFYTSGTTGFPKACAFQVHRSYALGLPRLRTTGVKQGPMGDVWYINMPMFHGTACTVIWSCMITGVTLAIGRKFSIKNFWHDIYDSNAAAFVYVGETARYLLAAPPSSLDQKHKLKVMHGNGLRPEVWTEFQMRFNVPTVHEFFSSTEGGLSLLNASKGEFFASAVGHHGLIKRSLNHNILVPVKVDYQDGGRIWRDSKTGFARRTRYDEGGEIIVQCKSESQIDFPGYWGNPDATAKRFERNVLRKGDCYYRTGDALRRDMDGRWFFIDRLGDTFRWKSENVSTAEVAHVLGEFPKLVEANVYGVEVPNHEGRAGCAAIYIHPQERDSFDYNGLLKFAKERLPNSAVPVFLRLIKSPTLTHVYKQDKRSLRGEGVNMEKIMSGDIGNEDEIFWAKPGASQYVPFKISDWNELYYTKARL